MAGTILHRSKIPIQEWFWAAYLVATHTQGSAHDNCNDNLGYRVMKPRGISCSVYVKAW